MSTSISIPAGTTFYRYDLSETPSIWNGSYHSIEYSTKEGIENIHKNQCGLLFFYETESTTIKTAERALERHNKTEFWLTTAYVDKPLHFEKLNKIKTIHVYGFSFSPIDLPYLSAIISKIDLQSVQWEINYFTETDKDNINHFIESVNIPKENVRLIRLTDIQLDPQLKIPFE